MTVSTDPYALVVDDDPQLLVRLCDIVEEAGFRSYDSSSGDDALEQLRGVANHVTLLFSDVEMPGGTDGFALARHVAATWPWIEIVIASGVVEPREGDMPEKATFIPKPFTAEMVLMHLQTTLPDGKKPEPLKRAV